MAVGGWATISVVANMSDVCRGNRLVADTPAGFLAGSIRKRFVEQGFEQTLERKKVVSANKLLDGQQEAKVIATRLGPPPKGYANWTLRLLARKVVELEIVASISHETVRQTLKKTE